MVGGAARAAILAAVLALACVCISGAQSKVSLSGINAERHDNTAAIELQTSTKAGFKLDRFTMGNWVYVWSPKFDAPAAESAFTCDLSNVKDLVTSAALSRDGKRSGIRIYISKNADPRSSSLLNTPTGALLLIPAKVGNLAADKQAKGTKFEAVGAARAMPVSDIHTVSGTLDFPLNPVLPPTDEYVEPP
jgi:hypothetical protein